MDRGSTKHHLAIVLGVAITLRVLAAIALQLFLNQRNQFDLIPGDAEGYWQLAQNIVAGHDFAIYTPPRHVLRMPGFPLLIAASMSIFGNAVLPARLLLAVTGGLACGLVYWLGRVLFDRQIAFAGGMVAALMPTFIGFSALFLSETAFAAALVASLIPAAYLVKELPYSIGTGRCIALSIACGLLIGVATYMRPSWLLAAPIASALMLIAGRARPLAWCAAITIGVTTFLSLLPWGLRNERLTGHLVLTTLWMGPSLYDSLSPTATGESDMAFYDRENKLAEMSEYEVDRQYRQRAWKFARENPARALKLSAIKLWHFWSPWPNAPQFQDWPHRIMVTATFVVFFGLAVRGLIATRPSLTTLALTLGPIVYFSALHTIFIGSLRYRLPAEYPIALLAGAGFCRRTTSSSEGAR
jgi:4-amino-4-deoxy-L-arabinose transferase-like glycosyltransferase